MYLYLDWIGYSGGSVYPDLSRPVAVYAFVAFQSNWSGSDAACYYRRYDVRLEFYDQFGVHHWENVGWVVMGHGTFGGTPVGSYILPNLSRPSGGGSAISYIGGIWIGDVYNGSGACSSGAHVHLEARSLHNWGGELEWRSDVGPDYFPYPSAHVHGAGGGYPRSARQTP